MRLVEVFSQKDLDAIPVDYNGRIIIKFGNFWDKAIVRKKYKYPVEAWGNSSVVARGNSYVVARGNSSVEARENSSVEARENSSVEAWGNSSVVARGNSYVEARENSSVVARGNSSVVARGNSYVVARGNSQITDRSRSHNIGTKGNARIIYDPRTAQEYIEAHDLDSDGKIVKLYKAVRKNENGYQANYDGTPYVIGSEVVADCLTTEPHEDCGHGIHMAYKEWAVDFGKNWPDLAILELEAEVDGLVVPLYGVGKVRAAKAKVIREVPLEECGLLGKILAKRKEVIKSDNAS